MRSVTLEELQREARAARVKLIRLEAKLDQVMAHVRDHKTKEEI